ncbi:carbonic anhydrase [Marasmius fiardii PR-910]|nr:carbonic anhydrase [Marasmius fiardii PR-910]
MIKARFSSVFLRSHNALYPKRFGHHTSFTSLRYCSSSGPETTIALPPAKKLIILTCMDARINPFKQLDIKEGDAHIIRNAGGMARDALRSIIISQRLLGTREIAVYHHTGCGMVQFKSPDLRKLVKDSDPSNTEAAKQVDKIDFLEFKDLEESVKSDVEFLKTNPLVMKETKVSGWVHYVETGKAKRII